MPENSAKQEGRSSVSPKDQATVPASPTSSDRDAKTDGTEKPEDEKRIERFRER